MTKENIPHILLVEDENALGNLLKENLRLNGFSVNLCKDGAEGWEEFQKERFEICIFDINMPKKNGYELAQACREINQHTPIIFLTANSSEEDKLKAYDIGGDDYITKPFSTNELLARIKAIIKRTKDYKPDVVAIEETYEVSKLKLDIPNHILYIGQIEKRISNTEGELLRMFMKNKNQLLTRNAILLNVWGRDDFYTARNLDVYVNKIRKLIKDDNNLELINIHGSGFKLIENDVV